MNDLLSLEELESKLGNSIKDLRLLKNIDRQTLCARAGISMNALRNLENGTGATIKTLILVIRALDRLDWINGIAPQVSINPLYLVRGKPKRMRASRKAKINDTRKSS